MERASEGCTLYDVENVTAYGGSGNDSLSVTAGSNALFGNDGDDNLTGGTGNDTLNGGAGNDSINAGSGADTLRVGTGVDIVDGGAGTDTLLVLGNFAAYLRSRPNATDTRLFNAATGEDITLRNIESLTFLDGSKSLADVRLNSASIGDDSLLGTAGNDTLDGLAGTDTLVGLAGDDTYVVDVAADVITENPNEGLDQVSVNFAAAGTYVLPANVENATVANTVAGVNLTGNAGANMLYGNATANMLTGLAGSDSLRGGGGADTLVGGDDRDYYYVYNTSDVVIETNASTGSGDSDLVFSYLADYTLTANVERLWLFANNANGTGNSLDNSLYAGSGDNVLDGGAGNDTLDGGSGNDTASYASAGSGVTVDLSISTAQATGGSGSDTLISIENLIGSEFNDRLTGNSGANRLEGGAGGDSLRGGGGADTLVGGDGRDYYYVYNASDVVIETNASTGSGDSDLVFSYLSDYTLTANVERLWLFANNANGTGNSLDNSLYASSGDNVLDGGAGNDTLDGGSGNDTASYASAGSGVTVSLGITTAQGTGGSDSDTLISIENLIGSQFSDRLTGNGSANRLAGGAGNDTLSGGSGNDTLDGGTGNDTASYASAGSGVTVDLSISTAQATGGSGSDTLISIENLIGSQFNDRLTGNSGANRLEGGAGSDSLRGGGGADTLVGGDDRDYYYVYNASDVVIETNPARAAATATSSSATSPTTP
jgi:Ca2+-binding RTX toxin-like protein